MENNKPVLSISMLASDRLDTLPRCLESLTPIREAVPSELIIVDTSQNPKVHDLVVKYADKVCTFEWCNDFAKARNVGLKMAEGEWFMFIDDDEWFAEPEELVAFFVSGEYKKYGYAQHRIKNFQDPELKIYAYGWVARLTKLWKDTTFHSRVHEYLTPFKGEAKILSATSYHTGYIYKTEEESKAHFERNVTLLKKMEEEEPKELRWKIQMLQEYITIDDWQGMANYGKAVFDSLWSKSGSVNKMQFATIHIAYAIALNKSKQYELVDAVYQKAKDVVKDSIVTKAYMELCMAQSAWALKKYENAKSHVLQYLEGYEIYTKDPFKYASETIGIFLSDTFQEHKVVNAYSILLSSEINMCGKTNRDDILKIAQKYICSVSNIFYVPQEIAIILEKYEIKVADLYMYIDFIRWKEVLNNHLEEIQMEQVEELKVLLENSMLANDIRYYYFMMVFVEQKLLIAEKENLSFDEMTDLFASFSDFTCISYEELYGEQLQMIDVENWPEKYRAAKWLKIFFERVGEDMTSAIGCLAKIVAVYPVLSNAIQYYLKRIQLEILNN